MKTKQTANCCCCSDLLLLDCAAETAKAIHQHVAVSCTAANTNTSSTTNKWRPHDGCVAGNGGMPLIASILSTTTSNLLFCHSFRICLLCIQLWLVFSAAKQLGSDWKLMRSHKNHKIYKKIIKVSTKLCKHAMPEQQCKQIAAKLTLKKSAIKSVKCTYKWNMRACYWQNNNNASAGVCLGFRV